MLLKVFAVLMLAWVVSALPPNSTAPDLTPWTNLGITLGDAALFFDSGTSPQEGFDLIETERALFNGIVAFPSLFFPQQFWIPTVLLNHHGC